VTERRRRLLTVISTKRKKLQSDLSLKLSLFFLRVRKSQARLFTMMPVHVVCCLSVCARCRRLPPTLSLSLSLVFCEAMFRLRLCWFRPHVLVPLFAPGLVPGLSYRSPLLVPSIFLRVRYSNFGTWMVSYRFPLLVPSICLRIPYSIFGTWIVSYSG